MLLNCLQAIIILLPSVGSTEMDGSFAASPRMLLPWASTFAWKLVNTPNCEIMRGEVSIFRGGAGGMLYFSSGSLNGGLRIGARVFSGKGGRGDCRSITGAKSLKLIA